MHQVLVWFVLLECLLGTNSWSNLKVFPRRLLTKSQVALTTKPLIQSHHSLVEKVMHLPAQPLYNRATVVGNPNCEHTIFPFDYVTHIDYGFAQFLGWSDHSCDIIRLYFRNGHLLEVPSKDFHKIYFWMSADEGSPSKLSSFNEDIVEKWKYRWNSHIRKFSTFAKDILLAYDKHRSIYREPFPKDSEKFANFERSFIYEPSEDQLCCFEDVYRDMVLKTVPMKRVLFGCHGVGKFEVAARAIYRAVLANKQVLILSSSLTQSRYLLDILRNRMPKEVSIDMFRGKKYDNPNDTNQYLTTLRKGQPQVFISTMAFFGKKTISVRNVFKSLGLVVTIDEGSFKLSSPYDYMFDLPEYANVDSLTLTSLPCPKALTESLTGVTDFFLFKKQPHFKNIPVQTLISVVNSSIVEQNIRREMKRKGQTIIVSPDESLLYDVSGRIKELIKNVKVTVLPPDRGARSVCDLRTLDFVAGGADVLILSTAPDFSLDFPNAKTILVLDAHRLRLSELFKCKQGIESSTDQTFAHFLVPDDQPITDCALRRLLCLSELKGWQGLEVASRESTIRSLSPIVSSEEFFKQTSVANMYVAAYLTREVDRYKENRIFPVDRCEVKLEGISHLLKLVDSASETVNKIKHMSAQQILKVENELSTSNSTTAEQKATLKIYLLRAYACSLGVTEIVDFARDEIETVEMKVPAWTNQTWQRVSRGLGDTSNMLRFQPITKSLHILMDVKGNTLTKKLAVTFSILESAYKYIYNFD